MTPESAIAVLWVAWVVSWGVAALWSNRTVKAGGLAAEAAFRIPFWLGAILLFAPFRDLHFFAQVQLWRLDAAMKWVLVVLIACGLLFVWWARIHLGRLWSAWMTKKAGHHVIDTGPYRLVRHPIYSGLILSAFATAIEKGTSFALLGRLLPVPSTQKRGARNASCGSNSAKVPTMHMRADPPCCCPSRPGLEHRTPLHLFAILDNAYFLQLTAISISRR